MLKYFDLPSQLPRIKKKKRLVLTHGNAIHTQKEINIYLHRAQSTVEFLEADNKIL